MSAQDWVDKDFYKVLGVSKDASDKDIKKAFRKLARENHPDQHPGDAAAEARFKEVSEANSVLSNPDSRREYDEIREMVANGGFGNDVIRQFGGKGNDVSVANGGFGNDRFELGVVKGNNRASLNGGAGYDSATIRAGKNVTVVGADGEVIFQRGNGGSVVRVNSIEDLQVVGKGGKTLYDSTPDPVC